MKEKVSPERNLKYRVKSASVVEAVIGIVILSKTGLFYWFQSSSCVFSFCLEFYGVFYYPIQEPVHINKVSRHQKKVSALPRIRILLFAALTIRKNIISSSDRPLRALKGFLVKVLGVRVEHSLAQRRKRRILYLDT